MPSRRKRNKYTFGLYAHIYFSIPSLPLARPLTLSLSLLIALFFTHTHAHTISLSHCIFIFILYIDTKLSPPVNKYRQQWPPPKGGSFSYFNASSWSYPLQPSATPLSPSTTCLFVHYSFTGQCRGSKRSSRSSVHFFSHFLFFFLLYLFLHEFFSRDVYLFPLLPHSTPPLAAFHFSHNCKPNHTIFCVCLVQHFCKTYPARRLSLPNGRPHVQNAPVTFTVRGATVNRNYFNGERYRRSGLETK